MKEQMMNYVSLSNNEPLGSDWQDSFQKKTLLVKLSFPKDQSGASSSRRSLANQRPGELATCDLLASDLVPSDWCQRPSDQRPSCQGPSCQRPSASDLVSSHPANSWQATSPPCGLLSSRPAICLFHPMDFILLLLK
ncbi:UNVERIFIED_CONTAM: hypothetical protein Slati_0190500 [Sesamum latifolium]|uniref:Uncharacterized protein n=1 Tax=Sesamum latifolium TaxID=2727402 RepID=A0AAW2YBB2_9LAMI